MQIIVQKVDTYHAYLSDLTEKYLDVFGMKQECDMKRIH